MKFNDNETSLISKLFKIVYVTYGVLTMLNWTQLGTMYPIFQKIYLLDEIFSFIILYFIYLHSKPKKNNFIIALGIVLYLIYVTAVTREMNLLLFTVFFLAARSINYIDLFKRDIYLKIFSFLGIFYLGKIGFFPNMSVARDALSLRLRETFGFNYPTYAMYSIMIIGLEWLIIRKNKITYIELLCILILDIFMGNLTDARGEAITLFLACLFSLLIYKVTPRKIKIHFNNKIVKYMIILMPEIFCIISYCIVYWLKTTDPIYNLVNSITSSRMDILKFYLTNYGVHTLPINFDVNYINGFGEHISAIDNGYLYLGIRLGLICLIIYLSICSYIIKTSIDTGNNFTIAIIFAFMLLNLVEYVSIIPAIALYCVMRSQVKQSKVVKLE